MQTFTVAGRTYRFQWASDVEFDGLRLEGLDGADVVVDVSVPTAGTMTVNTFATEAPAELIEAALDIARRDRTNWR